MQRQYTGTTGRIENSQVAVYLTYAATVGHALMDRALYLPRCLTDDAVRRRRGVGAGSKLRKQLCRRQIGYVLAVAKSHQITTGIGTAVPSTWRSGYPKSPVSDCRPEPAPKANAGMNWAWPRRCARR